MCILLVTKTCNTRVSIYQYRSSYIIKHWPAGNFMKNKSIRAYYCSTPREPSIKRITRIVSQNLQKAKQLTARTSTSKTATSQTIVDNRMWYTNKSPEEQRSAKFSQAACLEEDSSGTDADADLPWEVNPAPPEPKQDWPKKKCSMRWQRTLEQVHIAHMEMCGKAVKMISKIEGILDRFNSDSSARD